jgi:hypothetical protein
MRIDREGDMLTMRRSPNPAEEAERRKRFRRMPDELTRMGPVSEVGICEPFECPERPGL